MSDELEACLPDELRGRGTTIAPMGAGLSGAGVYRVDAAGGAYVLKVAPADEPVEGWRTRARILRAAADAGVAPRVVHVDEARRAVVSELVADLSLIAGFVDPAARAVAIGAALGRVHALPVPDDATGTDTRRVLDEIWASLDGFPLPAWTDDVVRRALDEPPPPDRAPVLSHNDVNPSNLVYDGERVLFLDWDAAGANDPMYDLATVALFSRFDDATCARLIAAHDRAPLAPLPARFIYLRRIIAALCGALFLRLARSSGHPGADDDPATLALAPTLADVHGGLRTGAVDLRTPDGRWQFGHALLAASARS